MLKAKFFQIVIIFCVVLGSAAAVFADTIRLKDGSVIKGRIIGFREGQFTVQIGDGTRSRQMTFFSDEIDAIEFDASNSVARNNTAPTTLPTNPNPSPSTNPNTTKIIVGQNNNSSTTPITTPTPVSTPQTTQTAIVTPTPTPTVLPTPTPTPISTAPTTTASNPPTNNSRPKPIQLSLKVLADNTSNGWTNAGWVVRKGQKIKITSTGRVSLGKGNYATPAGIASLADKDKLMQARPTGELIAVIGDDNNDFIPIGTSKEFIATRDGALFLGINEGVLDDNSGAFDITVEIDPSSGN
jgi:hypothetical protein